MFIYIYICQNENREPRIETKTNNITFYGRLLHVCMYYYNKQQLTMPMGLLTYIMQQPI